MEAKNVTEETWKREIVTSVMRIVSTRLPQKDLISLLLVSPWLCHTLLSYPSIWLNIDLREKTNAGDRLLPALSLPRYRQVKRINLNRHLQLVKSQLRMLESERVPKDTDKGMQLVAESYQGLESLNVTRCVKITDDGVSQVLQKCSTLQNLNLYALSGFTDKAYKKISLLADLRFLDLRGAQNLSDEGLAHIAKCIKLGSLNLTWCVRITDAGVITIANSCTSLEFLSLFGIVGVTDRCLETLSQTCSATLTTLDVNGCIGIKRRSHEELLHMFSRLTCFKVHS